MPRKHLYKRQQNCRRSRGRLLVLFWGLRYMCFRGIQNQKYRLASYLMEHMYLEAQLCNKISIFNEILIIYIYMYLPLHLSKRSASTPFEDAWNASFDLSILCKEPQQVCLFIYLHRATRMHISFEVCSTAACPNSIFLAARYGLGGSPDEETCQRYPHPQDSAGRGWMGVLWCQLSLFANTHYCASVDWCPNVCVHVVSKWLKATRFSKQSVMAQHACMFALISAENVHVMSPLIYNVTCINMSWRLCGNASPGS